MAYTYYGTTSDVELAKKNGIQGNFYDVAQYGEESKYKDLLHAYKTGANPIILGGAGATGGVNDNLYKRLLDSGANITRIGGKDRYEVQSNLKTYVDRMNQSKQATGKTPSTNPAKNTTTSAKPALPQAPGGVNIPKFQFDYKNMNYQDATGQVQKQLEPIYKRALETIQAQKYQNELGAGEQAAARGLAHSGLAADLQNKVAIAAQNQIADASAQKSAQIAEMAQALVNQDQARGDALRQQAYQEYLGGLDVQFRQNDTQYQRYRDVITDALMREQTDYQKQRDAIGDQRYNDEMINQKQQQQVEQAWRQHTFNNMSASEKQQLEWAKQVYGEDAAWKMYELKYNGELQKSQAQTELQAYQSGFLTP